MDTVWSDQPDALKIASKKSFGEAFIPCKMDVTIFLQVDHALCQFAKAWEREWIFWSIMLAWVLGLPPAYEAEVGDWLDHDSDQYCRLGLSWQGKSCLRCRNEMMAIILSIWVLQQELYHPGATAFGVSRLLSSNSPSIFRADLEGQEDSVSAILNLVLVKEQSSLLFAEGDENGRSPLSRCSFSLKDIQQYTVAWVDPTAQACQCQSIEIMPVSKPWFLNLLGMTIKEAN